MNSGFRTFLTSFLLPATVASVSALLMFQFLLARHFHSESQNEMSWIREATRLISERYYEEVSTEELAYDAIRGMASRDRWSGFIDPADEARFREETEGNYVGIGFAVYLQGEPLTVLYPFEGSPSALAGLTTGDRIVGVDGQDLSERSSNEIVERIKLKDGEGVPVTITVQPYAAAGDDPPPRYDATVTRANIQTPSVVDPRIVDQGRGIAYVRAKAFHGQTAEELSRALAGLTTSGMKSLILDLRGNRGGFLDQAIDVTSLFVQQGVVVSTRGRTDDSNRVYRTESEESAGAPFRGLPLVLLVDGESASASEIVAGALRDHQRAMLVGSRTFGKGFVQSLIFQEYTVEGEKKTGRLKLTTSRYFTPAGRSIGESDRQVHRQSNGVTGLWPDIAVPVEDRREQQWLEAYLADREIPETTWQLIRQRCPERSQVVEGDSGFTDRALHAAVRLLRGEKVFNDLQ